MFKDKKFLTIFILETVLPWLVGILGAFAIFFFDDEGDLYREGLIEKSEIAGKVFKVFYGLALGLGGTLLVALFFLGLTCIVLVVARLLNKEREQYSVMKPLVLWGWSIPCSVGTMMLILLTAAFTYGMSV